MSYTIAEVAEAVGVPPSTLRYYESQGIVRRPPRGANGYRMYEDRDVARLQFAAGARRLNLSLPALRELVEAWDSDDCSAVQHRMIAVEAERQAEARQQIAGLTRLTGQLQETAERLRQDPGAGACSDSCGCAAASPAPGPGSERFEGMGRLPTVGQSPSAIACTLAVDDRRLRQTAWRSLIERAIDRTAIDGGIAIRFPAESELASELGRLAVAEEGCCSFFSFRLLVEGGSLLFEVRAPGEAAPIVAALFGTATSHTASDRLNGSAR